MDIPFFSSDYKRQVAQEPYIQLLNRFAEQNPALNESAVTVISRPAMKKVTEVGDGPIRKIYNSPGVFNGDAFIVSGTVLYRIQAGDFAITTIGTISTTDVGDVSMAATAPIGTVPAYLYIAEGGVLWVYTEDSAAIGHLEASGSIANNDTLVIDNVYYKWTTGSVDTGTPDGSSGTPWLVDLGATNSEAITNMYNAINASGGTEGTDYTTGITAHPTVEATGATSTDLYVLARAEGTSGNSIATTETGANVAWASATLTGGGSPSLRQVSMPDDVGAISVAHINSYIIVVPIQETDTKGRFYWIEPGEKTVDPLNFATAERNPDGVHQVIVFGDLFWLLGENTTEPWQTTGNPAAPMQRYRGILFDRGSWEGTAVQVKDSLIVVDEDGGVFQIHGNQERISTPNIEERIRRAKATESSSLF